jgi:CBS domain-containing protein/ribosome-associated translation inhibitor RaiA
MTRLIQLRNIKAKDVMSERLIICQKSERVSEVLGRMKKMDIHELPVVESGKLLGMVSYDMFIKRKSLPLSALVENIMVMPPKVDVNTSITKVAEVMLTNNFRAVPVTAAGEVAGIIAREDIVSRLVDFEQLEQINVKDVMTPDPITIMEDEHLEKARAIMRDLDVRALPVVDAEGRLTGVLGIKDIMAYYTLERAQRKPAEPNTRDTKHLHINISSLMSQPAISMGLKGNLLDAVKKMADSRISSVVVVESRKPVGIVTQLDVLELVASYQERRQVYVQITGLDEQDPDLYDEMYRLIEKTMNRITPITMPQLLMLHFTEHHRPKEGRNFTVRARLSTSHGLFFSEGNDYELFRVLDAVLDHLEKQIVKDKDRTKDRREGQED